MNRLKLVAIEQKPKKIIIGQSWRDPSGIARNPEFVPVLLHIRKCIENGAPLPSTYYSKAAGSRTDALLQSHGIMHLHLGRWNTNELLWLVQYSDRVVWLELSDHAPFRTRPPGIRLFGFHQATLRNADTDATKAAEGATKPAGKIRLRPKPAPDSSDSAKADD